MKKGNLVLYKNQPALITDVQGDKFEITLESGTKKVREKDIVLMGKLSDFFNRLYSAYFIVCKHYAYKDCIFSYS